MALIEMWTTGAGTFVSYEARRGVIHEGFKGLSEVQRASFLRVFAGYPHVTIETPWECLESHPWR